jgi:hypothetical protein
MASEKNAAKRRCSLPSIYKSNNGSWELIKIDSSNNKAIIK